MPAVTKEQQSHFRENVSHHKPVLSLFTKIILVSGNNDTVILKDVRDLNLINNLLSKKII